MIVLLAVLLQVSSFDDLARRAAEARDSGRVTDAIGLYREAVEVKKDWAEGWFYLGTLEYSAGRPREAADAFTPVLRAYPKNGVAWAFKGLCLAQLREMPDALEALLKARTYGVGDNAELVRSTRYALGILLTRYSRFDEARRELETLVDSNPESEDIHVALGLSALLMPYLPSDVPASERALVRAVGRAASLARLKRREEADQLFAATIATYPKASNAHYAYGLFLVLQGESEKAECEFRAELEITPSNVPARLQLTNEALRRGDTEGALPYAREAAERAPEWYLARQYYGKALLAADDVPAAVKELEAAAQLRPEDPATHFQLARAYRASGQRDKADRENAEFVRLENLRKQKEGPVAP